MCLVRHVPLISPRTSDLVWNMVFVFEHVAALKNGSLGASTHFKLQVMETGLV